MMFSFLNMLASVSLSESNAFSRLPKVSSNVFMSFSRRFVLFRILSPLGETGLSFISPNNILDILEVSNKKSKLTFFNISFAFECLCAK